MDHYRYYTVHMTKTRSLRVTDTLTWVTYKVVMYLSIFPDIDIVGTNELTIILMNPSSTAPLAPMDDTT